MAFENLNVRIGATTQGAQSGLSAVQRELSGLSREAISTSGIVSRAGESLDELRDDALGTAGGLQLLQGRADEAKDEIRSLNLTSGITSFALGGLTGAAAATAGGLFGSGKAADSASSSFSALTIGTSGLSVTFGVLSSVVIPAVIAALAALSTTLVPITATIGAVAAAGTSLIGVFGGIIGSGILAFGAKRGRQAQQRLNQINQKIRGLEAIKDRQGELTQAQQDNLEALKEQRREVKKQTGVMGGLKQILGELKAELTPIIVSFGNQFVPLVKDAIDALPGLVQEIINAVGGLDQFRETLRDLGGRAAGALPGIVSGMVDLAERAVPPFLDFVDFLAKNAPAALDEMVATAEEVGPILLDALGFIINKIPAINEFGIAVLNVVDTIAGLIPSADGAKGALMGVIGSIRSFIQSERAQAIIDQLRRSFRELKPELVAVGQQFLRILGNLRPVFDAIIRNLPQAIRFVTQLAAVVLQAGQASLSFWNKYVKFLRPLWVGIIDLVGSAMGELASFISDMRQTSNVVQAVVNRIKKFFSGLWMSIKSAVAGIVSTFVQLFLAFDRFMSVTIPKSIVKAMGSIIETALNAATTIRNGFVSIFNGIVAGIEAVMQGVVDTVVNGVNSAIDRFNKLLRKAPDFLFGDIQPISKLSAPDVQGAAPDLQQRELTGGQAAREFTQPLINTIEQQQQTQAALLKGILDELRNQGSPGATNGAVGVTSELRSQGFRSG